MSSSPSPTFPSPASLLPRRRRAPATGFTLVELLVVAGLIGILASLLLPALAKTKSTVHGVECVGRVKQLTLAWLMYADDHEGRVAVNRGGRTGGWVGGELNFDGARADNTNVALLVDSRFARVGPYVSEPRVFKCPSDASFVRYGGVRFPRVRSMAMNQAVGADPLEVSPVPNQGWRTYRTTADITAPGPSSLWILVDEHPDSLDDGRFLLDLTRRDSNAYYYSWPANFHDGGSSFAFSDGHSERHEWQDPRTRHENRYCGCLASYARSAQFTLQPGNRDVRWLQERTSAPVASR